MKKEYKVVTFKEFHSVLGCGHAEYAVVSVKRNIRLGVVRWNVSWNKYGFWPDAGKVLSEGVMMDIGVFIRGLPDERKIGGYNDKDSED